MAKVKELETTDMPSTLYFTIDVPGGACPIGTWLKWVGKGSTDDEKFRNSEAVYGTLISALLSDKKIHLHGLNASCEGQYLKLLAD